MRLQNKRTPTASVQRKASAATERGQVITPDLSVGTVAKLRDAGSEDAVKEKAQRPRILESELFGAERDASRQKRLVLGQPTPV